MWHWDGATVYWFHYIVTKKKKNIAKCNFCDDDGVLPAPLSTSQHDKLRAESTINDI